MPMYGDSKFNKQSIIITTGRYLHSVRYKPRGIIIE